MDLKTEVKCAETVLNFLLEDQPQDKMPILPTPMQKKMDDMLGENNTDMLPFTQYLNHKYKIYDGLLWSYSAKEFFSTTKAVNFYRKVIRKLKIDLIYVN